MLQLHRCLLSSLIALTLILWTMPSWAAPLPPPVDCERCLIAEATTALRLGAAGLEDIATQIHHRRLPSVDEKSLLRLQNSQLVSDPLSTPLPTPESNASHTVNRTFRLAIDTVQVVLGFLRDFRVREIDREGLRSLAARAVVSESQLYTAACLLHSLAERNPDQPVSEVEKLMEARLNSTWRHLVPGSNRQYLRDYLLSMEFARMLKRTADTLSRI